MLRASARRIFPGGEFRGTRFSFCTTITKYNWARSIFSQTPLNDQGFPVLFFFPPPPPPQKRVKRATPPHPPRARAPSPPLCSSEQDRGAGPPRTPTLRAC